MAEKRGPKRMDGYIRVSRRMGRAGPGYISPKIQREAVERWAEYRSIDVVAWHEDEDQSGGTQNRPGIREAIRRVEAGETEGIACWRLNRFARNVSAAIDDVKRIEKAGGYLAFVEEDIDPTGPFGSFLLTVLLAVATLERDNLSSGWQAAKTKAVGRGVKIGKPPIGYERDEAGVLKPSPEASIVKTAFRLAGKDGLHVAMKYLEEQRPDRVWTPSTTRRLLGSRTYLGEVLYGDLVNANAHKPLVSRAEWEAAQRPSKIRREANADFPLSGIALCAGCHHPLVGSRSNGVRVYRCKYQYSRPDRKRVDCPEPAWINADKLEKHAIRVAKRMLLEGGWKERGDAPQPADVQQLEEALEEAEAELYAFGSDLQARRAYGKRYHELLEERVEARDVAKEALGETTRKAMASSREYPEELFDTSDPKVLRELLSARFAFRTLEISSGREPVEKRVRLVARLD